MKKKCKKLNKELSKSGKEPINLVFVYLFFTKNSENKTCLRISKILYTLCGKKQKIISDNETIDWPTYMNELKSVYIVFCKLPLCSSRDDLRQIGEKLQFLNNLLIKKDIPKFMKTETYKKYMDAFMKILSEYCICNLILNTTPITELDQLFVEFPAAKFVHTILGKILKLSGSPDGSDGSDEQCQQVI